MKHNKEGNKKDKSQVKKPSNNVISRHPRHERKLSWDSKGHHDIIWRNKRRDEKWTYIGFADERSSLKIQMSIPRPISFPCLHISLTFVSCFPTIPLPCSLDFCSISYVQQNGVKIIWLIQIFCLINCLQRKQTS